MVLSLLGRKRVAVLLKNPKEMERPSDIEGLLYIPFTDNLVVQHDWIDGLSALTLALSLWERG